MSAASTEIDTRPICFDIEGAMAYTGLSKWRLNELARTEAVIVRKEGSKNLYMRESLDRYIRSLPTKGEVE